MDDLDNQISAKVREIMEVYFKYRHEAYDKCQVNGIRMDINRVSIGLPLVGECILEYDDTSYYCLECYQKDKYLGGTVTQHLFQITRTHSIATNVGYSQIMIVLEAYKETVNRKINELITEKERVEQEQRINKEALLVLLNQ